MANEAVQIEMQKLKERLQKMRNNLTNPSPTMAKVAILMHKDIMKHFSDESDESGKWADWAPITIANRRTGKAKGSPKKLQDTGRLRASIRPDNTKDSATVGTDLEYAATHNYGRDNIPQRKFLWLSDKIKSEIEKLIGKFVTAE